jgi:hypothetical protein
MYPAAVKQWNTRRPSRVHVNLCPIASTAPSPLDIPADPSSEFGDPGACELAGVLGVLERPQHAMQFLHSLIGVVAMMRRHGFDASNTSVDVAIVPYGRFQTIADVRDVRRFPHMELLPLLSDRGLRIASGPRGSGLRTISPNDGATSNALSDATTRCYQSLLIGSAVVRMLHYKRQQRWRHEAEAQDFIDFRQRLIQHFRLHEERDWRKRHALIVSRAKRRRRLILNEDELIGAVSLVGEGFSPKVVDWEGMPLREQLQEAINSNAIIGMHGNGHAWSCFMPNGSWMIEISSNIPMRNEVASGRNRRNVGNLAGVCPIESHSFRSPAVANPFSVAAFHTREWKEADVRLHSLQLRVIRDLLRGHQALLQEQDRREKWV